MTKERYNEIMKRIEELQDRIFIIEMIDHWTREDWEYMRKYEQELKELKEQIVNVIFED